MPTKAGEAADLARRRHQQPLNVRRQCLEGLASEPDLLRWRLKFPAAPLEDEGLIGLGVLREAAQCPEYLDRAVQALCRDAKPQRVGIVDHRRAKSLAQGVWRDIRVDLPMLPGAARAAARRSSPARRDLAARAAGSGLASPPRAIRLASTGWSSSARSRCSSRQPSKSPCAAGSNRRTPVALALHAHGDQPDARLGVEPAVEQLQFWRTRLELQTLKGGAEELATALVRHWSFAHNPQRPPRLQPACVS
jgi:hypothetical protein